MSSFERAAQDIERNFEDGHLSQRQYDEAMRDLERDERAYAEQEAQRAYDDVLYDHGYRR